MRRSIKTAYLKAFLLVLNICFINSNLNAFVFDTSQVKNRYLKHFSEGQYMEAEHELWRLYYLNETDKTEILYNLGEINKKRQNWDSAQYFYKQLINDECNAKYCAALYQLQFTSYLLNDAISEVYYYRKLQRCQTSDDSLYFQSNFISLLHDVKTFNWEEAKTSCRNIFSDTLYNWDSVFASIIPVQNLSVKKAKNLSIIPGAGQWYAGEKNGAIRSIVFQSALAAGAIILISNQYYILAALAVIPLLYRLHEGGKSYAVKIAQTKNEITNTAAAQKLQNFIIQYARANSYF